MKLFLLSFLFITYSISSFAQFEINVVNVSTNDLVYDSVTDRIYASVPSSNGSNGNSIGIINPNTYLLENTIFIGSEPSVLAISDDGQFIYSGFNGSATVRRFNVSSQTPEAPFSLGNDPSTGGYYVEDIEVMPNTPNTIAISRKNNGFSPRHEGVVIYDNDVMRPNTTQDHTGSNKIEFTNSNTIVGYNNETTEFGIRKITVDTNGATENEVTQNILSGFGIDFTYHNDTMYATNGVVVDVASTPFVIGQFTNTSGPVVYDTNADKVCYADYDFSGNITFKRFNPTNFLVEDNLTISQASGNVNSIITCGNGCYAFNSTDNKVIIVKDTSLSVNDFQLENTVKIFPNPTNNYINITSKVNINKIQVVDVNGKLLKEEHNLKNNKLDLSNLNAGIYLVKIMLDTGEIEIKKIVKT